MVACGSSILRNPHVILLVDIPPYLATHRRARPGGGLSGCMLYPSDEPSKEGRWHPKYERYLVPRS